MAKATVVALADTDTHADPGRVVNGLMVAKEFKQAGNDVRVIFDGASTKWPRVLSEPRHRAHALFEAVADRVAGACGSCAQAFDTEQGVKSAHLHLLKEYEGHPSIRRLVADRYQVITF